MQTCLDTCWKKKKKKNDHTQIMRNFIVASNEVPSAEGHRFHF